MLVLRNVRRPVLPVRNPLPDVLLLLRQVLHNLDRRRDGEEVNETDVLVTDDLDLVDRAETREVVSERLLRRRFVEVADVNVSRRAGLLNGGEDVGGDGGGFAIRRNADQYGEAGKKGRGRRGKRTPIRFSGLGRADGSCA
jgi:hypothetical protein